MNYPLCPTPAAPHDGRVRAALRWLLPLPAVALLLAGCAAGGRAHQPASSSARVTSSRITSSPAAPAAAMVPRPRHTVIVMMENHSYGEIIGNPQARYLNYLARHGALFTRSFAITHPSEPNYLALFSGRTHGVTSDACPVSFRAPNLARDLLARHLSFTGYAEDLPATGSLACSSGNYARKHVPWTDFPNVPRSLSRPFSRWPLGHLARLPAVSFVIPNLCHDMHNCGVAAGDDWLRLHLGGYASWAMTHDSVLIVTWDEDDGTVVNHIPTIFYGQPVRPGRYRERITHYSVLRTIEAAYGLRHDGHAATTRPITNVWKRP
jgi:phosphatidylinositol-3-phosphatase